MPFSFLEVEEWTAANNNARYVLKLDDGSGDSYWDRAFESRAVFEALSEGELNAVIEMAEYIFGRGLAPAGTSESIPAPTPVEEPDSGDSGGGLGIGGAINAGAGALSDAGLIDDSTASAAGQVGDGIDALTAAGTDAA